MEINFYHWLLKKSREYRAEKFAPVARFLLKKGVSSNLMTFISFLFGMGSVYFLFSNYFWFIFLGVFHLLSDALDGVIAKTANNSTPFGKYFDLIADRIIAWLYLVKIGIYLHDYYPFLILGLNILPNLINWFTHLEYPVIYARTTIFLLLFLNLPVVAYLAAGVISLCSLVMQFQQWLSLIINKQT